MITHIRMKNFKSWQDSDEVKLAPLTGFFGTNSSGKSSLLQMLLLLKQTVGRKEVLFFGDENSLVNLGNFREVIHGHNMEASLKLEFGCKLQNSLTIKTLQEVNKYKHHYGEPLLDANGFTFDTVSKEDSGKVFVEYFSYTVASQVIHDLKWRNGNLYCGDESWTPMEIENCYTASGARSHELLGPLSSAFENLFDHVYPLGATRVQPKRLYHWEGTHPREIDLWGNKAIDALLSARVRQLKSSNKEDGVPIEDRISEWLQRMGLAHSFWLGATGSLTDNNYEIRIRKSETSAEVTLADMGHGLTDLLPLLVHCYYVPEGSTLILEQPGIHLHPMAQADLADLLIEVITERKLQILVESHSEHLLTRLQRRIAEQKISQDDTALYFCRNNDGASTIEPLDVNEFGEIKNWPENFFGDVMGDMFAMTDVQAKRMAQQNPED